jgi:ribonuclease HI
MGEVPMSKGDLSAKGTWTEEESCLSINILEMKAVILGMQAFQSTLWGKCITLFSDNSTVIVYIRRQGGYTPTLCAN